MDSHGGGVGADAATPSQARKRSRDESAVEEARAAGLAKIRKRESDLTLNERKKAAEKVVSLARVKYTTGDFALALERVKMSLKIWPHNPEAYQLMGLMAQEAGEEGKALELWLIQAHFDHKNIALWQNLYHLASSLGRTREEVYCLAKVHQNMTRQLRLLKKEDKIPPAQLAAKKKQLADLMKHRLCLFEEINEYSMAIKGYSDLLKENPADTECVQRMVRILSRVYSNLRAQRVCEKFLEGVFAAEDRTAYGIGGGIFLCVCNMALELLLDQGRFHDLTQVADKLVGVFGKRRFLELHPDLATKCCIAQAFLGDVVSARENFNELKAPLPASEFGDITFDFAMAMLKCGQPREAIALLEQLAGVKGFALPIVVLTIAKCNMAIANELKDEGQHAMGLDRSARAELQLRGVLKTQPWSIETRLLLAEGLAQWHGEKAFDEVVQLLDYRTPGHPWSSEDSMRFAFESIAVLRSLDADDCIERVVTDMFSCLFQGQTVPDAMSTGHKDVKKHQGGSSSRLQGLADCGYGKSMLYATSVLHSLAYGNTGADGTQVSALEAVAALPLHAEKTNVAQETAKKTLGRWQSSQAVAQGQGTGDDIFTLRKIGSSRLATPRGHDDNRHNSLGMTRAAAQGTDLELPALEDLQEDLEIARFLGQSDLLRKAYELANSDDGASEGSDADADLSDLGTFSPSDDDDDDGDGEPSPPHGVAPAHGGAPLSADMLQRHVEKIGRASLVEELLQRHSGQQEDVREAAPAAVQQPESLPWTMQTFEKVVHSTLPGIKLGFKLLQWLVARAVDSYESGSKVLLDFVSRVLYIMRCTRWHSQARGFYGKLQGKIKKMYLGCMLMLGNMKDALTLCLRLISSTPQAKMNPTWNALSNLTSIPALHPDVRILPALCERLQGRDRYPAFVLMGNVVAARKMSQSGAVGPYLYASASRPEEPLPELLLVSAYAILLTERTNANPHTSLLQALAHFDEYKNRRGVDPTRRSEIDYNLGRLFHHVGLFMLAAEHYERCLQQYDDDVQHLSEETLEYTSMHREAAFNLSLIYRHSGNERGAADLLRKYIVI